METIIKWHDMEKETPVEDGEYLVSNGDCTWVAIWGSFRDGATYDEPYYDEDKEYEEKDLDIPETVGWYTKAYGMAIYWGNSVSITEMASDGVIAWTEFPVYKKEN